MGDWLASFDPETTLLIGRVLGAALALGLGGIGAAIGMGITAGSADESIMRQPEQQGPMLRTMLIGQAVGGSPSIFALVIGLLVLFVAVGDADSAGGNVLMSFVGAGIAIGLGCLGSALGCGWPSSRACEGVARNPRRSGPLTQAMIIGQAIAQSPAIFATVVALILVVGTQPGTDWLIMGSLLGAGIAIGASALGAGLGGGWTAGGAVASMSAWPKGHGATFRTMLIGQATSQTPAVFGLLIAFIMLYATGGMVNDFQSFAKMLGAAIAVGFGGIGPGFGSGLVGGAGCLITGPKPERSALFLQTMLIGQAVSQSTAIYSLIIALLLIYVV